MARRGDHVLVRVHGGDVVERIVWEETRSGLAICTEAMYREAMALNLEPPTVGFRWEFVVPEEAPDDPAP